MAAAMAANDVLEGFLVHVWSRTRQGRTVLYLLGRLSDGRTFAAIERRHRPYFFVRRSELEAARRLLAAEGAEWREPAMAAMDGEPCLQALFPTSEGRQRARETLARAGLRTYEADLRVADQFRIERGIHGSVRLRGESRPGRQVDLVFIDPQLEPSEWDPRLSVLSLDIETEVEAGGADAGRAGGAGASGATRGRNADAGGTGGVGAGTGPASGGDAHPPGFPGGGATGKEARVPPEPWMAGGGAILAIGLAHRDPFRGDHDELLYAGGRLRQEETGDPAIRVFATEAELLTAFARRLRELDPDVITGWNVADFDLRALAERFRAHALPFRIGRSEEEAAWLAANQGRASRAVVPGRQVWDALRIVRAAPERYEDYSLQTVAESVLGYGKRIEIAEGEDRLSAITRLHREDPEAFCRYCLQDARLVQEIFAKTGLVELTLRRCQLIGVAPDLAWTSIPAFEHLYIEAMHGRGVAAPTAGVDALPVAGAPGGGILSPRPGVYDRVLLFDFQSLYPSIIRSFNIDPLSHIRAGAGAMQKPEASTTQNRAEQESRPVLQEGEWIEAPNGARFRREPAILPELLDRFFESRRQARQRGDEVASFVYKIIMNSFYGVLGASGCRFAGSELAGAITSFGQHILSWCRDYLEERGRRVLYGDTDSLFVLAPGEEGEPIAAEVNGALSRYLAERWRIAPRFVLEYEKEYERFFLPPMRGEEAGGGEATDTGNSEDGAGRSAGARGRAKSYAGLVARSQGGRGADAARDGEASARPAGADASVPETPEAWRARIEVKGMEAVRRDWTDLAHDFQLRLLELLFRREPLPAFQAYIAEVVRDLHAGRLDGKLVYRKALRKPVAAYTRNTPPHVKAAGLLAPGARRGLIRYLVTVEGPQPQGCLTAAIDYGHYVEKQLKPIASGFSEVLGTSTEALFGTERQLNLF
jgi:DNA polymerase-2